MAAITTPIAPDTPDRGTLQAAARKITSGGVVVFPTRCLYGLGADALDAAAVERVYQIKQRPAAKPLLVLIRRISWLDRLVREVSPAAVRIMQTFWPGDITLVFSALDALPQRLTAGTGRIGVRMAAHPVAAGLVTAVGGPVTGTSANLSGSPGCSVVEDLAPAVADQVDLILDAGPLSGGVGSTVVDVAGNRPRVLREGTIPARAVFTALDLNI